MKIFKKGDKVCRLDELGNIENISNFKHANNNMPAKIEFNPCVIDETEYSGEF